MPTDQRPPRSEDILSVMAIPRGPLFAIRASKRCSNPTTMVNTPTRTTRRRSDLHCEVSSYRQSEHLCGTQKKRKIWSEREQINRLNHFITNPNVGHCGSCGSHLERRPKGETQPLLIAQQSHESGQRTQTLKDRSGNAIVANAQCVAH